MSKTQVQNNGFKKLLQYSKVSNINILTFGIAVISYFTVFTSPDFTYNGREQSDTHSCQQNQKSPAAAHCATAGLFLT